MKIVIIIWKILLPILVISVLIFIHELGHFTLAKLNGVRVNEFALGMGPKLFGVTKGETLYALRAFPIGGFVRMEGEDENSDDPNAFNRKTPLQRISIVVAGPIMNFILAFLIYMIGVGITPVALNYVDTVAKNSPAQTVGLQKGDKIVAINDKKINLQEEVSFEISFENKGKPMKLTIERNGHNRNIRITPKKMDGEYRIGFSPEYKRLGFADGLAYSGRKLVFETKLMLVSLKYLITGKVSLKQVAGPVGMGKMTNDVAKTSGFFGVIMLGALLSINLGLINLLPLPALDGGRTLFLIIELFRGKPVDQDKEAMVHFVGFVLLMVLMLVITFSDIVKLVK